MWVTVSKLMRIFVKFWLFLRCPSVTQDVNFENFLFCPNFTFNIKKSHKVSSEEARLSAKNLSPPPVPLGLKELKFHQISLI